MRILLAAKTILLCTTLFGVALLCALAPVTVPLGLGVSVVAGLWFARSITRPIARIAAAAEALGAGDRPRLKVEGGGEIGDLARSFNRMADGIAGRERNIADLALTDSLTGLPNRVLFHEHLTFALRTHRPVAMLCVDLDDFQAINATAGALAGDEMLRRIADRLSTGLGNCFVARLGGDAFAIVGDGEGIERLAQRVIELVGMPVTIDGAVLTAGASIGIAMAPGDGEDSASLLDHAEQALRRAQAQGRHTFCFFDDALNDRAQVRSRLESDLRTALSEGHFQLHFQPLFDLSNNRIGSFEALLRWNHPARGMIAPADFVPVAEESGLIVEIGAWALREACAHAATWPDHIRVAVNVSSVQCRRPGLSEVVLQALTASHLTPSRLELEITEQIFVEGSDATLKLLHSLRAIGVRIAFDNFGTGYSSLSHLQRFPFDRIKIDRSFIHTLLTRPGATAIVRAITDLANALGMETTAEGVEESDQLAELRRHGCSSVQGYLFSRAIDARAVHALLADENPDWDRRRAAG